MSFTNNADSYTVTGTAYYILDFLDGTDRLTVNGGTFTTAHMGTGDDLAILRSGDGRVYGDDGDDRFDIYGDGFQAYGDDGNDWFNLRGGNNEQLTGGAGFDRFNFLTGSLNVTANGGLDSDRFYGNHQTITGDLYGDEGNDRFVGFDSGVTLHGGVGNDIYRIDSTSAPTLAENAGEGNDVVQLARGISYTLPDNIERLSVRGIPGSSTADATLTGNALNNSIIGHNNNETIYGLAGNDFLYGNGGVDTLDGGEGKDHLYGGSGNDIMYGHDGNDVLDGGTGDDWMAGGPGDDIYYVDSLGDQIIEDGGAGNDTARVTVSGYTLADNVENGIVSGSAGLTLTGNALDNLLIGNVGDDTLYGMDGNDVLRGGGGNDNLYGGNGDDILNGGTGADYMNGGAGDDTYFVDNSGDVVDEGLAGSSGNDTVWSTIPDYTLGTGVENGVVWSGTGGTLNGNLADNHLTGSTGDDTLNGGGGTDVIRAGGGNDTINGGLGSDVMTGGAGADTFVFTSLDVASGDNDQITDFQAGVDTIDLSGIDANSLLPGDQGFGLVGLLTGIAGQLLLSDEGNGNYLLSADVNGDMVADFGISLHLTAGNIADVGITL